MLNKLQCELFFLAFQLYFSKYSTKVPEFLISNMSCSLTPPSLYLHKFSLHLLVSNELLLTKTSLPLHQSILYLSFKPFPMISNFAQRSFGLESTLQALSLKMKKMTIKGAFLSPIV